MILFWVRSVSVSKSVVYFKEKLFVVRTARKQSHDMRSEKELL